MFFSILFIMLKKTSRTLDVHVIMYIWTPNTMIFHRALQPHWRHNVLYYCQIEVCNLYSQTFFIFPRKLKALKFSVQYKTSIHLVTVKKRTSQFFLFISFLSLIFFSTESNVHITIPWIKYANAPYPFVLLFCLDHVPRICLSHRFNFRLHTLNRFFYILLFSTNLSGFFCIQSPIFCFFVFGFCIISFVFHFCCFVSYQYLYIPFHFKRKVFCLCFWFASSIFCHQFIILPFTFITTITST